MTGYSAAATTLRMAATGCLGALLIPFESMATGISNLHAMNDDSLTYVGRRDQLEPGTAVVWENTSPTSWITELRPDVTFSNGEALTAPGLPSTTRCQGSQQHWQDGKWFRR